MNSLPPHVIREISYILRSQSYHRSLASLTSTNRQIRSSAVEVLFEELDWEEDQTDGDDFNDEDDGRPTEFMTVFRDRVVQGDEMPDVLQFVKRLTLVIHSTTNPYRIYSFLSSRIPRLQFLKLTIHISILSTTSLLPRPKLFPFPELKQLDLSFPHWHDCRISPLKPTLEDLARTVFGRRDVDLGITGYTKLESITLDLDLTPFSTFDLGIPPHKSIDINTIPQPPHADGRSMIQTPKVKIMCYDDELYHVPWVAKCLWSGVQVLEIGYTPRRGMPIVSGSFTEHCQSLTSLHTLRLCTTLVHPERLPRNSTAYPLKGSELKDIFRDLHEHMVNFGRLEYEAGLEGRLGVSNEGNEFLEMTQVRFDTWERKKERIYGRNVKGSAPFVQMKPTRTCCDNSRRLTARERGSVFATAIVRCKGGQQGLDVKTTNWVEYRGKVAEIDQELDRAADNMALHGGTWFPEEEPGMGGIGGGGGGGDGGDGAPMMWHGHQGPHGMQMVAVPGGMEFGVGMEDGSVSSFGEGDEESQDGWTTEDGDVEMGAGEGL